MEKLEEIYELVKCLTNDTIFMNEHASNLFHVECRIPEQKEELLPITEGCTHNSCSFCNMYQGIPFRMLSIPEVEDYLTETKHSYGRYCGRIQCVYLVGADPFALSARNLLERIDLIRKYLPNVKTITMYARTDNIASKSDDVV